MSRVLQQAFAELGTTEIKGAQHNSRIVQYAHEAGFTYINDDETPWCSIFVNWLAEILDLEKTNDAAARSWLNVGEIVSNPKPGDVVIFWRESPESWKGHVAVFMGYSQQGNIFCIGGNQSNSVSIACYDSGKILGFRRLMAADAVSIPKATLQLNSKGDEVIKLQNLLKDLNYSAGDADGIFGQQTAQALMQFQQAQGLSVDGVYGSACENFITSKNQE